MSQGLVVLGTVGLDTIRLPTGVRKNILGGSAAHCAMSASLFTNVHLCAVVGKDFPAKFLKFFREKGININSLQIVSGKTFRWEGEYKPHNLNTACTLQTFLGVIEHTIPALSPPQRAVRNIFLANYDPDVQAAVLRQITHPHLIGLDTMNLWIRTKRAALRRLLRKTHILFMNDEEARAFSGQTNLIAAARSLSRLGPRIVVIKKGEHGSLCLAAHTLTCLPAFPVAHVLDPTGAGDTFAGGVMGYLSRCRKITGKNLQRALAYGTLCSSVNVEGYGMDTSSTLTHAAIARRLDTFCSFFRF